MEESCPKCGWPRSGEACPRCGVVFDRFDEKVLEEGVSPEVLKLWEHVEEDWDDRGRHALFVEQAILLGALGYAAGCYRKKGDDPVARDQLERISSRLEQSLNATADSREAAPSSRRLTTAIAVILLLALAGLVFWFLAR